MKRSAIRERSRSSHAAPGFHFVSSGLRTKEKKGSGTPTDALSNLPCSWHGRCPPPYPPPHAGEDMEGAARLSAFHRGSDARAFARGARLQARLPGTRQERRSVKVPLPGA